MGELRIRRRSRHNNNLLLSKQPYPDAIEIIFQWTCFFGVMGSKKYICWLWSAVLLISLSYIDTRAMWKVMRALAGIAVDLTENKSLTARLSGTIFYTVSIISLILTSNFYLTWQKRLSKLWTKAELNIGLKIPVDTKLKKNMFMVFGSMMSFAILEHFISVLSSLNLNQPLSLILKQYVLVTHGFIIKTSEYSDWVPIPLAVVSTFATLLWNFHDLLIVLISMGLTSRYKRLNVFLEEICTTDTPHLEWNKKTDTIKIYTWRKLREAYVKQALLVRQIDAAIGSIIILSCSSNFYFICLQMFLVITQGPSSSILTGIYYTISLIWLLVRMSAVVLAASSINTNSHLALKYLYHYDTHCYNIEVNRLQNQLTKDYIGFSGMGFFYLNKTLLLQMASSILTYELVLIQFDVQDNEDSHHNATKH